MTESTTRQWWWGNASPAAHRHVLAGSTAIQIVAILSLAVVLRLVHLGVESFWLDEVIMVQLLQEPFDNLLLQLQQSGRPPAYVLLAYGWTALTGDSEVTSRLLSAIAGVASVAVMYAVGTQLFNRKVAALGALLMALSAFQIHYSQEHRYYSVLQLFALLAVLFYARGFMSKRWTPYALYVVFATLATYTHTHAVFLWIGIGTHSLIHAWLQRQRPRDLMVPLAAHFGTVIAILPALLTMLALVGSEGAADASASETAVGGGTPVTEWLQVPPLYAPFRSLSNFLFYRRTYVNDAVAVVAIGLIAVGLYVTVRHMGFDRWLSLAKDHLRRLLRAVARPDSRVVLLALWLGVPILVPFVLSIVYKPMYHDRYAIAATPAWYRAIGLVVYAARSLVPTTVTTAALALMMLSAVGYYYVEPTKEQWRETAAYVVENKQPDDAIALSYGNLPGDAYNVRDSFSWYYPERLSECYVDVRREPAEIERELVRCAGASEYAWLVLFADNREEEPSLMEPFMAYVDVNANLSLVEAQTFVGTDVFRFQVPGSAVTTTLTSS